MRESKKVNWLPLFGMNFLSVMNDNYLKVLAFFIATTWISKDNESIVIMLASALFVLPYIAFSPLAGRLAYDYPKVKIIRYAKLAEIPIMVLASLSFIYASIELCLLSVFFMGLQSALFSPAKYGIIKDIGGQARVPYATGAMEMLTFLGVLTGTFLAGICGDLRMMPDFAPYEQYIQGGTLIGFAVLGYVISLGIKAKELPAEEERGTLNPIRFVVNTYRWSKKVEGLNVIVFSLATFWAIGSLLHMNITIHCEQSLSLSNQETSYVMALVAVGIALGCYITGVISNRKMKMWLVPLGGLGMFLSSTAIVLFNPSVVYFTVLIVVAAFSAGIYKIPLNAYIQNRVKGKYLGIVLAYNNLMVFSFILFSSGVFGLVETQANSRMVFAVISIIALVITLFTWRKVPGAKKIEAIDLDTV